MTTALEEATEHQGRARVALNAALEAGPSHAYLFRGPRGAGKRAAEEVGVRRPVLERGGQRHPRPPLVLGRLLQRRASHARAPRSSFVTHSAG